MGSDRSNDGEAQWNDGHCMHVGTLAGSRGVDGAQNLRIGVGDAGSDADDWALFMPSSGNGGGDFDGNDIG